MDTSMKKTLKGLRRRRKKLLPVGQSGREIST
jgi:hypothetical protein